MLLSRQSLYVRLCSGDVAAAQPSLAARLLCEEAGSVIRTLLALTRIEGGFSLDCYSSDAWVRLGVKSTVWRDQQLAPTFHRRQGGTTSAPGEACKVLERCSGLEKP